MAKWLKLLGDMVADHNPVSYTYDETASVLTRLDFTEHTPSATSHRKWTREIPDSTVPGGKRTVTIGLNAKGKKPLKPGYIRAMIRTLKENKLLPEGV